MMMTAAVSPSPAVEIDRKVQNRGAKLVAIVAKNGYCFATAAAIVVIPQHSCCSKFLSFKCNNFVKSTLAAGRETRTGTPARDTSDRKETAVNSEQHLCTRQGANYHEEWMFTPDILANGLGARHRRGRSDD